MQDIGTNYINRNLYIYISTQIKINGFFQISTR